jgi:hypothetical protein
MFVLWAGWGRARSSVNLALDCGTENVDDQERQALPVASNEKRAMQDARRTVTRRARKRNKNALKHGWCTTEAIAVRRLLANFRK